MRIVVGLSGGVDSSVAAYLLKKQGHDVIGMFMINWHDTTGTLAGDCPWDDDLIFAKVVAKKLGIPLHTVDLSEHYRQRIVNYMFREYEQGRTPNPDVLCNREIKWDVFAREALKIGAEKIATGHYCQVHEYQQTNQTYYRLMAGADINKDQSYFLCQVSQQQLKYACFPIGHMQKQEVRKIASEQQLATAERKDSQGLCFIGKIDLPTFLQQQLKPKEGDVIEIPSDYYKYRKYQMLGDTDIEKLVEGYSYTPTDGIFKGKHRGAHYYTIGQRKGLNIGGTPEPLFVISTDTIKNIVYVGQGHEHPGLNRKGLFIQQTDVHWLRPDLQMKPGETRDFMVRIRYRQALQKATLIQKTEGIYILFADKQRGITPGQFAAWYRNDELVGSGVIA